MTRWRTNYCEHAHRWRWTAWLCAVERRALLAGLIEERAGATGAPFKRGYLSAVHFDQSWNAGTTHSLEPVYVGREGLIR